MKFFQRIKHLLLLRRQKTFDYKYLSGAHYDEGSFIRKFYHRKRFHFIKKRLRLLNTKGTIVDVGSGSGNILGFLNQKNTQLIGIDLYQNFLLYAKNKVPVASFICADAHKIPIIDKSSDLTISCEILEHLQNPYLSIKELKRISRNRIFLVVPLEKSLIFRIIWILWCFIHKHNWGHIWKFDVNDIKILLEKNNLEIESICTWYHILLAIVAKVK